MRLLLSLLLIVYLVGVGVALAPTIQGKWDSATASQLFASVMDELPRAMAWPARVYRGTVDNPRHA